MCKHLNFFRLIEEVKEKCGGVALENEDVYMATEYKDFVKAVVMRSRGISTKKPFTYDAVSLSLGTRINLNFCFLKVLKL